MKIKPAPLTDRIEELSRQLKLAETYTDEVDVDIVDWSLTDMKTVSVEEALTVETDLTLNFDLMMERPLSSVEMLLEQENVKAIVLNVNCQDDVQDIISTIKGVNKQVLMSFSSPQEYEHLEEFLPKIDGVQVFTISPGAQGNPFRPEMLDFVERLRRDGFQGEIGLDGGVNVSTLPFILEHKVDYVSVGSALSKAEDPEFVFRELEEIIHEKE